MEDLLWNLFKKTGDIKYFLLLQKLEVVVNGDQKTRRDRNKRNEL